MYICRYVCKEVCNKENSLTIKIKILQEFTIIIDDFAKDFHSGLFIYGDGNIGLVTLP